MYLILVRSRRQVSSPSPVRVSPNHFQCKLNLTSRCLCGGDQSRAWDGVACLIEDGEVIGRRREIRPVKEIEEFGPELNVRVF